MPIRVDELVRGVAEVPVTYKGEEMNVTYYPDKFTPAMEKEARSRQDSEWSSGLIIDMLEPLVADWELLLAKLDENGKPVYDENNDIVLVKVPPTAEGMINVPINLLIETLRQVTEDMRPSDTPRVNSRNGSLTKVK